VVRKLSLPVHAEARLRFDVGDYNKAFESFAASAGSDAQRSCKDAYLVGHLAALAKRAEEASTWFAKVKSADDAVACDLSMRAELRSAEEAYKVKNKALWLPEAAWLQAHSTEAERASDPAMLLWAIREKLHLGLSAEAKPLLEALLTKFPAHTRAGEAATALARIAVDEKNWDAAVLWSHRALTEPMGGTDARALAQLTSEIPRKTRGVDARLPFGLTDIEYGKRLMLLAPTEAQTVRKDAEDFLTSPHARSTEASCRASIAAAQSEARSAKSKQADAWGDAITACAGLTSPGAEELIATAAYFGGKTSASSSRNADAKQRFAMVEARAPKHRLSDDARVRRALLMAEGGEDAAARALLLALPQDYPDADMKHEAVFRAALLAMNKGDFSAAKSALDVALTLPGSDPNQGSRGRARYFHGRATQKLGQVDLAKADYAQVIAEQPYSYYMALAFSALERIEAGAGKKALSDATARGLSARPKAAASTLEVEPEVRRAIALIEVEDFDAAKQELAKARAWGDAAEFDRLLVGARLFSDSGAWEVSHGPFRSKHTGYESTIPVGPARGAWELAFPFAYPEHVRPSCEKVQLPVSIALGIMREESAFLPRVKSHAGALGLLQLMPQTAKLVARGTDYPYDEESLRTPNVNVALGTKLLAALLAKSVHPTMAIAAYNAGEGAVSNWTSGRLSKEADLAVEQIPYEETRNYVKRVLSSATAYAALYDPKSLDFLLSMPETLR
jgi:soluble lytic murein transglycosylase-like protein